MVLYLRMFFLPPWIKDCVFQLTPRSVRIKSGPTNFPRGHLIYITAGERDSYVRKRSEIPSPLGN